MRSTFFAAFIVGTIIATACLSAAPAPDEVTTVEITANDTLKFSVTRIEVQPGQKVHVELKNTGSLPKEVMAHNWILLKSGVDITAYATAALGARSDDYQPKALADEVLAAIPLLGPKRSAGVTFEAPTTPGSYPYLCTFPGHFLAGMRGVLVVK
jgi:azurin